MLKASLGCQRFRTKITRNGESVQGNRIMTRDWEAGFSGLPVSIAEGNISEPRIERNIPDRKHLQDIRLEQVLFSVLRRFMVPQMMEV
jgi:hypothetical protein